MGIKFEDAFNFYSIYNRVHICKHHAERFRIYLVNVIFNSLTALQKGRAYFQNTGKSRASEILINQGVTRDAIRHLHYLIIPVTTSSEGEIWKFHEELKLD